ncbi:retrotransposon protein, putative, ty1-copia subclass [Tanacetum coccineum]|uniref:Retrotransposon protein, putative, ty1-copia subclass n=1 Tax=Tanacetum coccineum TaxID=301880 RepID=A0ABQ5DRH2_9ASTR
MFPGKLSWSREVGLNQLFSMFAKQEEGKSVADYVLKMKGYVEQLERLGYMLPQDIIGFRIEKKLKQGALYLYMGNGIRTQVEAIRSFDLVLPNGLVICLDNCHYAPTITRGNTDQIGVANTLAKVLKEFYPKKLTELFKQLTPPNPTNNNGSLFCLRGENRTLLDMVRSMMNLTTLPLSFWDYALESATRILNMVPTKKVDKTPYELWYGKSSKSVLLKILEEFKKEEDTTPSETLAHILKRVESFEPPSRGIVIRFVDLISVIDAMNGKYNPLMAIWVDYEETFSPVADIRAIRILISIAAYYEYEILQLDLLKRFLNCYLDEDIYMVQPEGFVDLIIRKYASFNDFIFGLKQASRGWNKKDLMEEIKSTEELRVECYCDAGLRLIEMNKSQTGLFFILNRGAVDWRAPSKVPLIIKESPPKLH